MAGPSERRDWTDARLDDRFAEIRREMDRLAKAVEAMVEVPAKLAEVAAKQGALFKSVQAIDGRMDRRDEQRSKERIAALEQREEEQKAAVAERKADKRYQLKLVMSCTGLILAGVTILVSVLT